MKTISDLIIKSYSLFGIMNKNLPKKECHIAFGRKIYIKNLNCMHIFILMFFDIRIIKHSDYLEEK